jgi:hypothetical protein
MKKGLVLVLMIIYGLSSFGAVLDFHYCCGKLDTINSIPVHQKHCCKAAVKKAMQNKGCCKDKSFSFKAKGEQVPAHFVSSKISTPVVAQHVEFLFTAYHSNQKAVTEVFAPPPIFKDYTILFCNFRI